MKYFVAWIVASILTVGGFFGLGLFSQEPEAQAESSPASDSCPVVVGVKQGSLIYIRACGQNIGPVRLNEIANGTLVGNITLPPLPTIKVPGPTIRLPRETVTVTRPPVVIREPQRTVTRRVIIPGDTETVTASPNIPAPTRTVTATATTTATATVSPTGQPEASRATITAAPETEVVTETETRTKTETIVRNVALGTLALLTLAALGMIALWLGYVLGYKGAERNEAKSLRNLLDSIRNRP